MESFAGPFTELILAGASHPCSSAFPDAALRAAAVQVRADQLLRDLREPIPLLELDGYWILAEVIQVPDLRRAHSSSSSTTSGTSSERERLSKQEIGLGPLRGRRGGVHDLLVLHGVLLLGGDLRRSGLVPLERGPGFEAAADLLVVFFAGPAIRGLFQLVRALYRRVRGARASDRFRCGVEVARRGGRADRRPARVRRTPGRSPVRPGRPGPADGVRAGPAGLPPRGSSHAFYVVREGRSHVEEEDPDTGDVQVLRMLERGESFGEMGLLRVRAAGGDRPSDRRGASSSRSTRGRSTVCSRIRSTRRTFAPTMQAMAELRELPPFARLGTASLAELLEHGRWATVPPGTPLVDAGEPSRPVLRDPIRGRRRSRRTASRSEPRARSALRRDRRSSLHAADREA